MTVQELRAAQHSSPFHPYRIRMSDGREYRVPHPDYVAMSPTGRLAYVFDDEGNSHRLDLVLMTSLVIEEGAPAADGNGGSQPAN